MAIDKQQSALDKQQIWRKKQIQIMYGSGRPVFTIAKHTCFLRQSYDSNHFFNTYHRYNLDNVNYIDYKR